MAKTSKTTQVKTKLPLKQELFCRYWIENNGNKTISALLAFDVKDKELALKLVNDYNFNPKTESQLLYRAKKSYDLCSAIGSEYYRKPNIQKRINELLDEFYFTDDFVKHEHYKLMAQDKDLSNKKGGIELYYKLKNKFQPEKMDLTIKHVEIPEYKNMSVEELKKLEADIVKEMAKK